MSNSHITPEDMISFVYNEIENYKRSLIEEHLETCSKCRKIRDELLETMKLLDDTDPETVFDIPPMGIEKRIISGIGTMSPEIDIKEKNRLKEKKWSKEKSEKIKIETDDTRIFDNNEIMTPCELARYLRVSENTVYELLSELPHFNFAGSIRFRKSSIDRWLEINEANNCSRSLDPNIEEFTPMLWNKRS